MHKAFCPSNSIMADILAYALGRNFLLRLLFRLPSFPVTGLLHEQQTPAFTATGICPGISPDFLIIAPGTSG